MKLVCKMHLTDTSTKEVAELQVITLKLFSTYCPQTNKNLYLDKIRFKLKNEEKMNYRNVLEIKKLVEQRLKNELPVDNFQDDYLA